MPTIEVVNYIVIFLAVYTQVFFFITFFEKRKKFGKRDNLPTFDDSNLPQVTFLVPCWNEEKTVESTVASIQNLDYPKNKIFISLIDDGSTDGTWGVMQKYVSNPQIQIFHKENGGKHTALNYALEFVKTELVASFDADTTIEVGALKKAMRYFYENPDLSAVGCTVLIKSPQTIAQKAQSIEYQMFSFSKKVLGLLGGALVVPGAYSVFKTKPLKSIGGWQVGHNLEDLELTYRLQTQGYTVEHSHDAIAFTAGPKTVRSLFKQRLRWGYGFINNTKDYRFAIFNKKFGNFGFFTLPMSILSYFIITTIFGISWYHIISFMYDKFIALKLVGIDGVVGQMSSSYSWFYFSTKALMFLSVLTFSFLLTNIILGRKVSNIKDGKIWHFFYFFILYSLLVPFWILKSVWNTVRKTRPAWR